MNQYAFYFDGTRCSGCKTCVYACKDRYDLDLGMAFRKVYEYVGGETTKDASGYISTTCFSYPVSVSCNHCMEPACVEKCPQQAMTKDEETGLVSSDPEKCIGCGTCATACPYAVPKVDEEQKIVRKCDGCAALVAAGERPACVAACPARALDFGTVDELKRKHPDAVTLDVAPLPSAELTKPNTLMKPCKDAKPSNDAAGELANPLEVA